MKELPAPQELKMLRVQVLNNMVPGRFRLASGTALQFHGWEGVVRQLTGHGSAPPWARGDQASARANAHVGGGAIVASKAARANAR